MSAQISPLGGKTDHNTSHDGAIKYVNARVALKPPCSRQRRGQKPAYPDQHCFQNETAEGYATRAHAHHAEKYYLFSVTFVWKDLQ